MAPKKTSNNSKTAPETSLRRSPRLAGLSPASEPPKKKSKTTPKTPISDPQTGDAAPGSSKRTRSSTPETKAESSKKTKTPGDGTPGSSKRTRTPTPEIEAGSSKKTKTLKPEVSKRTIIIEHCKQCNSFKTRATQVKEGLEESVEGVKVVVNPEKPRKGCFEIREEDGEAFVSLLDMKRPFTAMKNLDMDKVISDIVEGIK